MKLVPFNEYSELRNELNEFVVMCKHYDYRPKGSDFHEIIKFLLLNVDSAGGSRLCESFEAEPDKMVNHLENSFSEYIESIEESEESNSILRKMYIDEVNELGLNEVMFKGDSEYDNKKDFDTATGMVGTAATATLATAAVGAAAVGMYVQYLFKKGKLKKMVQKELDAELGKLEPYKNLAKMKQQLKDLADKLPEPPEVSLSVEFPTMAQGPELEPVPEPNQK
jgi:hypothetical protein